MNVESISMKIESIWINSTKIESIQLSFSAIVNQFKIELELCFF